MPGKLDFKEGILYSITLLALVVICFSGPIEQDTNYHSFADRRNIYSVPNFWNVASNIPFIIIGLLGIFYLVTQKVRHAELKLFPNSLLFFVGIFLTGIGSSYYHLNPTNETLLWDRLPMTISFMAFFSIVIGEFICVRSGKKSLLSFLMLGILSLMYWNMTRSRGGDDLRFYALVQFLPVLLIPFILLMYKTNFGLKPYFWFILFTYVIAKLCEQADSIFYQPGYCMSGHSLKHFAAALGPVLFLWMSINKRHRKK